MKNTLKNVCGYQNRLYICIVKQLKQNKMTTNNKIANRQTIADYFGTDDLTTHRILMNTNWGFFVNHFGNDAQKMWK